MPTVALREREHFDKLLRRFKKSVETANTLLDYHAHEFHEKPSSKRKRAKAAAIKRQQRTVLQEHGKEKRLY